MRRSDRSIWGSNPPFDISFFSAGVAEINFGACQTTQRSKKLTQITFQQFWCSRIASSHPPNPEAIDAPHCIFWPFMATGERVVALGCEWSTWNIVLLSELIGITMFLFISFYQWNYQLCSSWFFFWLAEKDFTVSPCPKGMGFVKLWGHAPASEYGTFHLVWPNGLSGMAITAHDWVLACKTVIFLTHITG